MIVAAISTPRDLRAHRPAVSLRAAISIAIDTSPSLAIRESSVTAISTSLRSVSVRAAIRGDASPSLAVREPRRSSRLY
ncbi:hypothetical protein [Nannocystis pusilla]|uniref:hypothetical protein n=1 Tax=Nannocystis pusilla TaxID=889268 RepID=UPI003B80A178